MKSQLKSNGTHIIADFYDCDLNDFCENKKDLKQIKEIVSSSIKNCWLKEMGNYYHYFDKNAITATVCLAESHLTFHTWPEKQYVSFDIFVCNYSQNNEKNAEKIYNFFCEKFFKSKKIKKKVLYR